MTEPWFKSKLVCLHSPFLPTIVSCFLMFGNIQLLYQFLDPLNVFQNLRLFLEGKKKIVVLVYIVLCHVAFCWPTNKLINLVVIKYNPKNNKSSLGPIVSLVSFFYREKNSDQVWWSFCQNENNLSILECMIIEGNVERPVRFF